MIEHSDFLLHYGIRGMKWGVRRWQNPDGSLTEAGKKHYRVRYEDRFSSESFRKVEAGVRRRLSNIPERIEREPVDIHKVMERGRLSESEARECSVIADKMYRDASKAEPDITSDVVLAVKSSGGSMYGLSYRLKQPTSIAAKIGSDSKNEKISFKDAADSIKDVIRYTSVSSDANYSRNYFLTKQQLESQGYSELRCRNYFQMYKDGKVNHKSIQSIFSNANGVKFELQFQTDSSQAAKNLKIPLYEERRKSGLSETRKKEIDKQMRLLAEKVDDPKDVMAIRSHG